MWGEIIKPHCSADRYESSASVLFCLLPPLPFVLQGATLNRTTKRTAEQEGTQAVDTAPLLSDAEDEGAIN